MHTAFHGCVNVMTSGGLVCLLGSSAGRGPLYINLPGPVEGFSRVRPGDPVLLSAKGLEMGDVCIDLTGAESYAPGLTFAAPVVSPQGLLANIQTARRAVNDGGSLAGMGVIIQSDVENEVQSGSFSNSFANLARARSARFIEELASGSLLDSSRAAEEFAGLGPGLTPASDDFICGAVLALVLGSHNGFGRGSARDIARQVAQSAGRRTTALSREFLTLASEGMAGDRAMEAVESLYCGSPSDVVDRFTQLLKVGHTSGTDFAIGMILEV
ncbi:MAG TPA: DUF2877 domain-containing protein, partial [Nitrososphaerales archaeon]|nr:DUF2877 domain-containing protein [Nitrososphaerales archaeon]